MEFQRGERVTFDFDSGAVGKLDSENASEPPQPVFPTFVGDILERDSSQANPPVAPSLQASVNGFPAHKKRAQPSAFKQRQAKKSTNDTLHQTEDISQKARIAPQDPFRQYEQSQPTTVGDWVDSTSERQRISNENDQKLAQMSTEEIEEAQNSYLQREF